MLFLQLTEAADVTAGAYSGGMRRRLSVALALLGDPKAGALAFEVCFSRAGNLYSQEGNAVCRSWWMATYACRLFTLTSRRLGLIPFLAVISGISSIKQSKIVPSSLLHTVWRKQTSWATGKLPSCSCTTIKFMLNKK